MSIIKRYPRLSIKDRYRLIKRVLKLALDKDTQYVNMLWINEKGDHLTHTFYAEGTSPIEPFLTYIATVSGKSKDLESLNSRLRFFLNKATVAFVSLNKLSLADYAYVGQPVIRKTDSLKETNSE